MVEPQIIPASHDRFKWNTYVDLTIARTEARTGFAAWKIRSSMTLYMAQSGTENREKPTEMIQIESGQS